MPRVTVLLLLVLAALAVPAAAQAAGPPVVRGSVEQVQVTGATPRRAARARSTAAARGSRRSARARSAAPCSATSSPARGYRVRRPAARRRAGHRAHHALGAAEHEALRPEDPGERLRLPDHARRHASSRSTSTCRAGGRARTRRWSSTRATATPTRPAARARSRRSPTLLGYAVVDVNMRGTGCSGGAFDYFEPLQGLDGYDVIETVARQPWVLHHKVGMMGISYGGISQLFVAATRPPSLAAITPLSVIDNTADDALPGRDPQHRLRALVGQGPRARRAARRRRPAARRGR